MTHKEPSCVIEDIIVGAQRDNSNNITDVTTFWLKNFRKDFPSKGNSISVNSCDIDYNVPKVGEAVIFWCEPVSYNLFVWFTSAERVYTLNFGFKSPIDELDKATREHLENFSKLSPAERKAYGMDIQIKEFRKEIQKLQQAKAELLQARNQ